VFPNPSTSLQVLSNDSYVISVQIGYGMLEGYMYYNTTVKNITLDVADGTLNRKDLVVVQLDITNRKIEAIVKKGTPGSSPVSPTVTRNDTIYEIAIAEVYVPASAASISQMNITDTRMDSTRCGWVNSTIQVDTSALFDQWESWYNTRTTEYETDWTTWVQSIQDQIATEDHAVINGRLDDLEAEDVVINGRLDDLEAEDMNHNQAISGLSADKANVNNPVFTGTPKKDTYDLLHKGNTPAPSYQDRTQVSHFKTTTVASTLTANSSGTWSILPLATEVRDNLNEYNTSTSQFTASQSGLYLFTAKCRHSFSAEGGAFKISLYLNGSLYKMLDENYPAASNTTYTLSGCGMAYLTAGDVVDVRYSMQGSPQNYFPSQTEFEGVRLN